jgi:radical SAM-linked protein
MRIQVTYSKTYHMKYTGHLDVQRTWERTLRRARLPLAYSQGFNKRPKINLAAALPLGFTSSCEIVEFWLNRNLDLSEIELSLQEAIPPGIEITKVAEIDPNVSKIPNLVKSADYYVELFDPVPDLDLRISKIIAAESLPRERRNKCYDLRPLIEDIKITSTIDGIHSLMMKLAARNGATGRPEEVLRALEIDPNSARVHRNMLYFFNE